MSKPLAEVCQFINRGISPAYVEAGGVAVLNQKCVRDHAVNFDLGRRHDAAAKKVTAERFVRAGDVLVNSTGTGTLGRVAQLRDDPPEPTTVDSHVTIVRPTPGLFHPEFFGYALVAIEEQIQEGGEGCGGQTELSRTKLAEGYRVSFPVDHNEQRRIVAILDEAFEGIATVKANAEKNLQNARGLFDRVHQGTLDRARAVSVERRLGDIADFRNGVNFTKQSKGRLVQIVGVRNFKDNFWVPTDDLDSITLDGDLSQADAAVTGDIFFVRSNGNPELIGRCMMLGGVSGLVTNSGFTIRMRLHCLDHMPQYVCQFLKSRDVRRNLTAGGTGINIKSLNQGMLSELVIPLPSMEVQRASVDQMSAIADATAALAQIAQRKVTALDELKNSLLHQAFTGQLTDRTTEKQVVEVA